jgi:transposase
MGSPDGELLIEARDAAAAARAAGQAALDTAVLGDLVTRYRSLAGAGLAANLYRRTTTVKDARRLARRFRSFEDMILRFATRPDLDIFSNNEAERTIRPAKVQQRSSGGCWRTLTGLAEQVWRRPCAAVLERVAISAGLATR